MDRANLRRMCDALQESLERLQASYLELQASRSRVVAAADDVELLQLQLPIADAFAGLELELVAVSLEVLVQLPANRLGQIFCAHEAGLTGGEAIGDTGNVAAQDTVSGVDAEFGHRAVRGAEELVPCVGSLLAY